MAKKDNQQKTESASADQEKLKNTLGGTKAPAIPPGDKIKYAFPSKSRCPRCGCTDTEATSVQGNVQYRRCRMPVCRWNYTVIGTKI